MLPIVHWQLVADFLALCFAFYALLWWARSARAMRIALGIVGLRALSLLALRLNMVIASWVLNGAAILAILVLLLVFQPELRRAFMRMDSVLNLLPQAKKTGSKASQTLAVASFELARQQLGALFVIVRREAIGDLLEGGVELGAELSPELLIAIFQKVSPLHDGAAIIAGGRLQKANVVLPLTERQDIPPSFGTRHRAAIGLAQRCDALVIAVSEERSAVTLMDGEGIYAIADAQQLAATLDRYLAPARLSPAVRWRNVLFSDLRLKSASVALAGLIWGMSFLASGATVRTVSVPIEFRNVPPGMEVAYQSANTLQVEVQGSPWIMDSVSLGKLVEQFDLHGIHPGWSALRFHQNSLGLPPGISVDRVTPAIVRVELTRLPQ